MGPGSQWKATKAKISLGRAFQHAGDAGKAKRLGVALRELLQAGSDVDLSHLLHGGDHGASVAQKDYYGDHALTYLCQNEACSAAMVSSVMSAPGGAALARDRSMDGDFPVHLLAANKGIGRNPGALAALLQHYPPAAQQRGKWGMLPLHSLCGNSGLGAECVTALVSAYPEAADRADGHHHKPIHYLCSLGDCSFQVKPFFLARSAVLSFQKCVWSRPSHPHLRFAYPMPSPQAEGLDALLSVVPEAGIAPVDHIGHRPLDLLARNPKAPVEAFEVLLHW
jgi:hypothetical protein